MIEDRLLILRFKLGGREALRQIYDRYKIDLLKLAVVLCGDVNAAEDIVHDVFVRFAQSAERIRLTGSLKSYLATSVVNGVRTCRRDRSRHREVNIEDAGLASSAERGPQQWAILSEQLVLLSKALQELPYEQREVVYLCVEMDMTFRRIAALQNTSTNTVKGRYRYAIQKLRSVLDGELTE